MRRTADSDEEEQQEHLERQLQQLERKQRKINRKIIDIRVKLTLLQHYTNEVSSESSDDDSSTASTTSNTNSNATNDIENDSDNNSDNNSEQQLEIGDVVLINNPGPSQENTGKIFEITPKGFYKLKTVRGNTIRRLAKNLRKLRYIQHD
jgi:hypothetical protein